MRDIKTARRTAMDLAQSVGMIATREILSVWTGLKTARIGVSLENRAMLESRIQELGLSSCVSHSKFQTRRDVGKGGWSNKFLGTVPPSSAKGDWLLYIARNAKEAQSARDAEEEEREFDFGGSLGVPACCARFYTEYQERAMKKQNDYVPFVLANSNQMALFDYRLNYVAQYFGYSLISFFPCSFVCSNAIRVAQTTLEMLSEITPTLAKETVRLQKCPILYTEYNGLFLFERADYSTTKQVLTYDAKAIRGTLPVTSKLFRVLARGERLKIHSINSVTVIHKKKPLRTIWGENVSVCIF